MSVKQGIVVLSTVLFLLIAVWGVYDLLQRRHTVLRLYPVIGHLRFFFESFRKEIQQYFVESDIDGAPISPGCRLDEATIPEDWKGSWGRADANAW